MSSNFPSALDSFTNPSAGQVVASAPIGNAFDSIEAIEAALGVAMANVSLARHNGFLAWTYDIGCSTNTSTLASTSISCQGIYLPACTITNLHSFVTTGQVVTNAFMAIYDSTGSAPLRQSTNNAANMNSAGLKTYALTSTLAVTAGYYYICVWSSSAGTQPTMLRNTNVTAIQLNAKVGSALSRNATSGTGATTTAPTPIGTLTDSTAQFWLAVS